MENMATATLRQTIRSIAPILALVGMLLVSLFLMGRATEGSARFGELFSGLLIANAFGLLVLLALTSMAVIGLVRQVRARRAGARLTARLVLLISLVAVTPVAVVYYFSLKFLHQGIDSWFDVRIENALEDAIELGRTALGVRMREHLKQTELLAGELADVDDEAATSALDDARRLSGAFELTLIGVRGQIISSSNEDPAVVVPHRAEEAVLLQARQGQSYIGLDPVADQGLFIRVVVPIGGARAATDARVLQALFRVAEKMEALADSVESSHAKYRELAFLRRPLKASFTLTLSLALALTVLAAIWASLLSARRVVAPLRELAEGTRAVADGDLETRVGPSGHDEIGFLLTSFNEMTRRLRIARDETRFSQRELEAQRAYLAAVLSRLSNGVMTLDAQGNVFTMNAAAEQILGIDESVLVSRPLTHLATLDPSLAELSQAAMRVLRGEESRHDVQVERSIGARTVSLRGAALASNDGHVLVFDDITAVVEAQRDAAWSEVARRLAHEIKNPLTPIQLSAERLRHKYLQRMHGKDEETFDRLTRTIVHQVEALKGMVDAFSDYARAPALTLRPTSLNALVEDVCELYRSSDEAVGLRLTLSDELPMVEVDADRIRQILHNLIKNAQEASPDATVEVATFVDAEQMVSLQIRDSGPGFPEHLMPRIFEPYVTSKRRGSGLGLAIVKRIVEEHGGNVQARNCEHRGAEIRIRLPAMAAPLQREAV